MENTEQLWVQALAAGDRQAFRNLYNRYWKSIYVAANRFLKCPEISKEVVVAVFSAVWIKHNEFTDVKGLQRFLINTSRDITFARLKKIAKEYVDARGQKA
jgi:hypothetical protein